MNDDKNENLPILPESLYSRQRVCKEIILLFSVFFLPAIITQSSQFSRQAFGLVSFNLWILISSIPQILLLLYVLELQDRKLIRSLGFSFKVPPILVRIVVTFAGLYALAYATTWAAGSVVAAASGVTTASTHDLHWHLRSPAMIPLVLLSSLAVGYREEIFFRAYLTTRLDQLGIRAPVTVAASSVLFALGHLYEGMVGTLVALVTGVFLALVYRSSRNAHQVAIAHGLYNFAILILTGTAIMR